jgi:uncharacterized protein
MIIDSHVHVDETSKALGWMDPPETMLTLMDEAGVDKAIIMTYMDSPGVGLRSIDYTVDVLRKYPDRFWGYARMATWWGDRAVEMFEQAILEYGLVGLKLHPVTTIDHPASGTSAKIIRKAADLKVPVLFHSGDEPMCTPYELETAALACPEATIIFGHMGGYFHCADAIEVAARTPNVYLDTSCMPQPAWIRAAVQRIGPERVMYASDGPGCPPGLEIHKVKRAGLTPAEEELVFSGNILRILEAAKR